jgi:thioesterase domain-containing protein
MNGNATFARRLAAALEPPRPVYGVRAIGLREGEVPLASVDAIARQYVADLKSERPEGPYVVLGQCGTAMVAYEMAQQLAQSGDEVAGLILGDPPVGGHTAWIRRRGEALRRVQNRAADMTRQALSMAEANPHLSATDRAAMVRMALWGAVRTYVPQPYPGRALLLHAARNREALLDPARGFPAYLPNLTSVEMEGDHYTMFMELTGETAAHIGAFLAAGDQP